MKKLVFSFFVLAALAACNNHEAHNGNEGHEHHAEATGNSEIDSLKEQVMAIHDNLMPVFHSQEGVAVMIEKLREKLPNLQGENQAQAQKALDVLNRADTDMMTWMESFNAQSDTLGDEVNKAYLSQQISYLQRLEAQTNEAVELANNVLKK